MPRRTTEVAAGLAVAGLIAVTVWLATDRPDDQGLSTVGSDTVAVDVRADDEPDTTDAPYTEDDQAPHHTSDGPDGPDVSEPDTVCPIAELRLGWPVAGEPGVVWVMKHLPDGDDRDGELDDGLSMATEWTYDGHDGSDFTIANFPAMDRGVDVLAAAPGQVLSTTSDRFDRYASRDRCSGRVWNHVYVITPEGIIMQYGHLRRDSVTVAEGEMVVTGQVLGQVGSSGCSAEPHLHFELLDCDRHPVDPFSLGLWDPPVPLEHPLRVPEIVVVRGTGLTYNQFKYASMLPETVSMETPITVGAIVLGTTPGELTLVVRPPEGDERRFPIPIEPEHLPHFFVSDLTWSLRLDLEGLWEFGVAVGDAGVGETLEMTGIVAE